jgi:predicted small secreted protein
VIVPARRVLTIVVLAALSLVLAACGSGGGSDARSGGSTLSGAALVRTGLLGFVAIDSDTGSAQWQQLDELAKKFPGRDKAIAHIEDELTKEGLDYESDVKPALGPEVDLAIASAGTEKSTRVVGLTKPDDPAKFEALVQKLNASDSGGDKAVTRQLEDGWYAISDSQLAITTVLKGDQTPLADDDTFRQAMGKLPADTLVKAFLDGQRVGTLASQAAAKGGGSLDPSLLGLDNLGYVAVSASAEDDGIRIHGASSGGPATGGGETTLAGAVPGDAFVLLDFLGQGTTDQLGRLLKSNPQFAPVLDELKEYGVTLDEVLALLNGEVAFYARPAGVIPELTLVLEPKDAAAALATIDKLTEHLAAASGGKVESGSQDGHPVKTVELGNFAIHYGAVDGKVLLTSGLNGIADFGASGDRFPDSADFKEAKDAAGMPDSTGGFAYIDVKDVLPLLEGLAALSGKGLPSDVTENLRPLRSFLAWSEGRPDSRTYDAFLQIK